MSDSRDPRELQNAFDEQADSLGLDPRAEPVSAPGRLLGIAPAGVHSILEFEDDTHPEGKYKDDEKQIEHVIRELEALHPDDFLAHWNEFATNPYVAVADDMVGTVEQDGIEEVLNGEEMQATLEAFPPHKPRKLEVSKIKITFIETRRAAATYRVEETFQNGKHEVHNCAAILIVTEGSWKITVVTTKHHGEGR